MSRNVFQNKNKPITWGDQLTLYSNPSPSQTETAFPLIGILAGDCALNSFTGNEAAFKRIQLALQKTGGLSFVFTPSSFSLDKIFGFRFDFRNDCWRSDWFPLPSVVYNRIPFRKMEQTESFQHLKDFLQDRSIPFFNDSFFHKHEVFTTLFTNEKLVPFLPVTHDLKTIDTFYKMVHQFQDVYLKPCKGKKGKGIVVVKKNAGDSWSVETIKYKTIGLTEEKLITEWINPLLEKEYIVQQYISPLIWRESRFDYRVLVHQKDEEYYVISGIGVRQSGTQQVTTHVPAGGKILTFSELPFKEDEQVLAFLANEIGKTLQRQYKQIGEFSMDVGKADNGDLYLFEVNSKPMVFDEVEIRRIGLKHLIELFTFLSKHNA